MIDKDTPAPDQAHLPGDIDSGTETELTELKRSIEDVRALVSKFNQLRGRELKDAVTTHFQSVIDLLISNGCDRDEIEQGVSAEQNRLIIFAAIGLEGEATVEPTFKRKIDLLQIKTDLFDANKERIDQAEALIGETASVVKQEMFSYQDVIRSEEDKQAAIEYTNNSESADKYARAIAKEIAVNGDENIAEARLRIRTEFDKAADALPAHIKGEMTHFAESDSWIYWDIGKQKYLSEHPASTESEADERRVYGVLGLEENPLSKDSGKFTEVAEMVQRSIASRHLGWELQQMAIRGVDMSWLTDLSEEARDILQEPTKEDGQLHSWQYVELGRVAQTILSANLVSSN